MTACPGVEILLRPLCAGEWSVAEDTGSVRTLCRTLSYPIPNVYVSAVEVGSRICSVRMLNTQHCYGILVTAVNVTCS